MKQKKIVVIVDEQYDFCRGGALEVPGATRALAGTCRFLEQFKDDISRVVLTADWHPITHCSFVKQGGPWPPHCVQHSHGAAIHERVLQVLHRLELPYEIVTKGKHRDQEEYGAFSQPRKLFEGRDVWIMGLAGDFCVMETALNLRKSNPARLTLYAPGIGSINAKNFNRLVEEHTAPRSKFRLFKNS
ncbi:MAG: isochorismatase family protein [Alloprevotella sp.]|nr:isochorismatase family protein [Alloprevotella sp.]